LIRLQRLGNKKVGDADIICIFSFDYFHGAVIEKKLAPYLSLSLVAGPDQFVGS
jgi:hypothetical protein